jgi:hypothetical protein
MRWFLGGGISHYYSLIRYCGSFADRRKAYERTVVADAILAGLRRDLTSPVETRTPCDFQGSVGTVRLPFMALRL